MIDIQIKQSSLMYGGIITQVIFGKAYDEEDVQELKDILRKVAPTANVVVIDKNKEEN